MAILAISLLAGTSAGFAQKPARAALLGRITPAEAATWANATVHIRSLGSPWRSASDDESITLQADERGRFRAQVLVGRRYAVWASMKTAKGVRITNLEARARAGVPIRLREQAPWVAKPVEVRGFDPWRGFQGLRYRVLVLGSSAVRTGPFVVDEAGRFTPPPLPPGRTYMTVSDATGRVVVPQVKLPAPSITLLKPIRVQYRILDRASGKPIADARLVRLDDVDCRWREIARTNADGRCDVADVAPREYGQILYVHAAGYRELASNTAGTRQADGAPVSTVELKLMPADSIRGRLRLTEDVAVDRVPLVLAAPGVFSNGYAGGWQRAFWTQADGSFVVPRPGFNKELTPAWQFAVFAALRPDQLEVLDRATSSPEEWSVPSSTRAPLYRYVPLAYGNVSADSAPRLKLRDDCLSNWTRVDLVAMSSDGRPARFARVNINVVGAAPGFRADLPEAAITDRRGRLSLVLPPAQWVLGVSAKQETFLSTLDLRAEAEPATRTALRCALEAPRFVTGSVRDASEEAIQGAVVNWRPLRSTEFGVRNIVESMARVVRTDAQGRFRLAVPAVCRGYSVGAYSGSRRAPRVDVAKGERAPKDLEFTLQ